MNKVFLVYVCDTTPHNFSSDWQDHRRFEILTSYLDEQKALERKAMLLARGNCAVRIESVSLSE
jgi:hypothetical protein